MLAANVRKTKAQSVKMDTTNNEDGATLIGKGKNLTCFMQKPLVDECKCHVLSPAGWSFSHLARTFKLPKCSSMEENRMNLRSNIEGTKKKLFFKEQIALHAYKCVIIQFELVFTTLHLYTY